MDQFTVGVQDAKDKTDNIEVLCVPGEQYAYVAIDQRTFYPGSSVSAEVRLDKEGVRVLIKALEHCAMMLEDNE